MVFVENIRRCNFNYVYLETIYFDIISLRFMPAISSFTVISFEPPKEQWAHSYE